MKWLVGLLVVLAPISTAVATPLSIKPGEAWAFRIARGEPAKAHKVAPDARPAKGEVVVTVKSFLGTMMTAINGTGRGYTFKAEIVSGGKASPARSCTLPANHDPILEQWPGKTADSVRLSRFVPAKDGRC